MPVVKSFRPQPDTKHLKRKFKVNVCCVVAELIYLDPTNDVAGRQPVAIAGLLPKGTAVDSLKIATSFFKFAAL